jgi:hypothetical protein
MKEEWLMPGAVVPVDAETTAALIGEIKRMMHIVGGMALNQRYPWVGLTDEEIAQGPQEVLPALYGRWGWAEKEAFEAVVAWAEAKLKDKNT